MAVGGLAVTPTRALAIEKDLLAIKERCGLHPASEIKYATCKKRRDSAHQQYIDYLFDAVANGYVHFHVRFSPFKEYDHTASGQRQETDTISKAFYQLLVHRAGRYYGSKCRLYVRPDAGECTSYLPRIIEGLNSDICGRFKLEARPIVDIAPRNSKLEPMLQLLDVSLGALTAARNGSHENGSVGARKLELIQRVLQRGKVSAIDKSDARERRDFNVWNVTPQWTKGAIPTR